ncbi:hypothetical protein C8R43DRAFT_287269 [Mycena crocata]|nr:hypothetical protein C8R43DRAFT_287269 [Mycena crocata]
MPYIRSHARKYSLAPIRRYLSPCPLSLEVLIALQALAETNNALANLPHVRRLNTLIPALLANPNSTHLNDWSTDYRVPSARDYFRAATRLHRILGNVSTAISESRQTGFWNGSLRIRYIRGSKQHKYKWITSLHQNTANSYFLASLVDDQLSLPSLMKLNSCCAVS